MRDAPANVAIALAPIHGRSRSGSGAGRRPSRRSTGFGLRRGLTVGRPPGSA